jgi:hypothetical protein
MRTTLLRLVLIGSTLGVIGVAGCGDDDSDGAVDESTSSTAPSEELAEYCSRAQAYIDATVGLDASTVESTIEGFRVASAAARAAADEAPTEVAEAHDLIASAGEDLLAELIAREPQTMDDVNAANTEIIAELEEKYGNLDPEVREFQEFATSACGITVE